MKILRRLKLQINTLSYCILYSDQLHTYCIILPWSFLLVALHCFLEYLKWIYRCGCIFIGEVASMGELMLWVLLQHSLFDVSNLLFSKCSKNVAKVKAWTSFLSLYLLFHIKIKTLAWNQSGLPGEFLVCWRSCGYNCI